MQLVVSQRIRLENILQTELNQPWCYRCGLDLPQAGRAHCRAGISKLRMIEGVEELGAKLQRRRFAKPAHSGGLSQRNVEVSLVWPSKRCSARIAVPCTIANRRRSAERRRVE